MQQLNNSEIAPNEFTPQQQAVHHHIPHQAIKSATRTLQPNGKQFAKTQHMAEHNDIITT